MSVNLSKFEFSSKNKYIRHQMEPFSKKNYHSKVEAIFTRFPSVQKVPFKDAYKPGLENMLRFEEVLGNPHDSLRTIHVAGTNGKGSVANMLASVLSACGLKVGLYTSPHIVDFRERMRVAGLDGEAELVSEEYVYDFLCRYEADMDALNLSFFEITTGMAFKWFADRKVDVAVIEVGLGGRLDSTNVITPDLSVVTSIALDHCALLGNTLAEIAGEKAGIFKKGVPALVGEYLPETRPVFEAKAAEVGCPLTFAEDVEPFLWSRNDEILRNMDLRGKYQRKNLRTVLAAVDILKNMPEYSGLSDSSAVVTAPVRTATRMGFHGRWERLSLQPFIIADIGHNPAALKENFAQLESMVAEGECSSLILVYAIMADKDLDGIMPLIPADATCIFTNPEIHRALPEKELTARYRAFCSANSRSTNRIYDAPDVRQALSMAINLARETSRKPDSSRFCFPLIYVGGSTYLVSEAVQILKSLPV
ncbi:MAG TPA: dihydrofolate synthase [Rikenellaceae bacterium]|nr:dihydrofolate synthase [Rikenellaceae bacterium]